MRKGKFIILLLLLAMFVAGCRQEAIMVDQEAPEEQHEEKKPPAPKLKDINIMAVGDIMVHGPQLKAQYDSASKTYDFRNNFKHVKGYFEASDLVIGNLETTFGGEALGYSSFPMFNTPDALAEALRDAGIDVVSTANNHTFDTGKEGIIRTLEVLEQNEILAVGTRRHREEKGYCVTEVNETKVGITAYTYETPRWGQHKTLNALKISKDVEPLIDSFGYEYLQEDLLKISERIGQMRHEGAELVIVYIHWGNEYQRRANAYQKQIAEVLADFGADIIFGSHPHVLQEVELLQSSHRDSPTLVVYSLGNFLSNQRYEILSNRYTEDGLMINVKLQKDFATNKISLKEVSYMPTWVHRFHRSGKAEYEILPLFDALAAEEDYHLISKDSKWRAGNSVKNTEEIIGISYEGLIPFKKISSYRGEKQ